MDEQDLGYLKMEVFKKQARNILGPSKKVKTEGLLDEDDYLDELYGFNTSDPNIFIYKT
jgi:hypothetical protein